MTNSAHAASFAILLLAAASLAGCDSKPAAQAPVPSQGKAAEAPNASNDAAAVADPMGKMTADDIASEMKSLEMKDSAAIQARADELWSKQEFKAGYALAEAAYKKDGNANAAYRLGTAHYLGIGAAKDLDKAWDYLNSPGLNDVRYALYYRGLVQSDAAFAKRDTDAAKANLERAKGMGVKEAEEALAALPGG